MDDDEDSRTSAVGRKRDLGAMEVEKEHEQEALSSGEDSHSHKRIKRSVLPADNEAINAEPLGALEISHAMVPREGDLTSKPSIPNDEDASSMLDMRPPPESAGQQVDQSVSRPIWNKSAQTGVVRTSFGGRQKNLPK